jgi:hypothetical protein
MERKEHRLRRAEEWDGHNIRSPSGCRTGDFRKPMSMGLEVTDWFFGHQNEQSKGH